MEITYLGHSSFRLKGKTATVVTDPFGKSTGLTMPKMSADIITVSHDDDDHNATWRVSGTTRRPEPYIIQAPGEYEISQVGVFGWKSYRDSQEGVQRGRNTIYTIHMDMLNIVHLGSLGHALSDELIENLGAVDILCVPVGGGEVIDEKVAVQITERLKPALVIPMHFKTPHHDQERFASLSRVDAFLKAMEVDVEEPVSTIKVVDIDLPEETVVKVMKSLS
jgi:L-ascorbate metabolism protein UlaG (beta-lactamase superfamily)